MHDLPATTGATVEWALGCDDAPREERVDEGWRGLDPREPTRTVWTFRDYLASSRGEVTVAKQAYVRSRGGWFSERSANYLAAGRPVLAQDTGWTAFLPNDKGLLSFSSAEDAQQRVRDLEADVAGHASAARAVAAAHFDGRDGRERLLSDAGVE